MSAGNIGLVLRVDSSKGGGGARKSHLAFSVQDGSDLVTSKYAEARLSAADGILGIVRILSPCHLILVLPLRTSVCRRSCKAVARPAPELSPAMTMFLECPLAFHFGQMQKPIQRGGRQKLGQSLHKQCWEGSSGELSSSSRRKISYSDFITNSWVSSCLNAHVSIDRQPLRFPTVGSSTMMKRRRDR